MVTSSNINHQNVEYFINMISNKLSACAQFVDFILDLDRENMSDAEVNILLSQLQSLKSRTSLRFNAKRDIMDVAGVNSLVSVLGGLQDFKSLDLSLDLSSVGDLEVILIAHKLQLLTNLRSLSLRLGFNPELGDAGINVIMVALEALSLKSLSLNLESTSVSGAGVHAIANVLKSKSLKNLIRLSLNLGLNLGVREQEAQAVVTALKGLNCLRVLDLSLNGTKLGDAGAGGLEQKLSRY